MRMFMLAGTAVLLTAAPALAQTSPEQEPDQQQAQARGSATQPEAAAAPGEQSIPGGGPGSGMVLLVPPSLGMPPGTVMVIPHHPAVAQGSGQEQGMAQQVGSSQQSGAPASVPPPPPMSHRPPPPPPMGAMFRFRHGGDEIEIRCPTGEPTQACIQAVGPMVDHFLTATAQAPGAPAATSSQSSTGSSKASGQ